MGKASKFKQIRKIASQLPAMNRKAIETTVVTGKELLDRGVHKVVNGVNSESDVVSAAKYQQKKVVTVPVNHNRNLKDAYKKIGMAGVAAYTNAANAHAAALTPTN